jgi:hypothetical protein
MASSTMVAWNVLRILALRPTSPRTELFAWPSRQTMNATNFASGNLTLCYHLVVQQFSWVLVLVTVSFDPVVIVYHVFHYDAILLQLFYLPSDRRSAS